jgi:hypothetical protein
MLHSETRQSGLIDEVSEKLSLHLDRILHEKIDLVHALFNEPTEYGVKWHARIDNCMQNNQELPNCYEKKKAV